MLDETMRVVKGQVFRPIASPLRNIHPLWFTFLGLLFGLASAVAAAYQQYWLGFFCWCISRALDALDGEVARLTNQQSDLGGYLDILIDHVGYAAVPIGVVLGRPTEAGFILLPLLLASFYINGASWMYLSALLEKRAAGAAARGEQTSVTMPAGLIGGSETIILYSAFLLLSPWYEWLFGLMMILVVITILQRIPFAVRELK